ncbi:MAG: RDD family protein [Bacteroidia bacterium]|nr:RDD family protein [Bacteroidia bacterium]
MNTNYAGFWMRFVAIVIDGIIISILRAFLVVPILAMVGISFATGLEDFDPSNMDELIPLIATIVATAGVLMLISTVIWVLYGTLMESSKYQATMGKLALGLIVTDLNGSKLDFSKALLRNLGKILSNFILMIGYIMAAFTEKKQGLHDIIAGTVVVQK